MHPKVSICLPNLNQIEFIEERMRSIVDQKFQDWECVAFDNHSDDGSWEVIQSYACQDARISAQQAERDGMYANWNNCIRAAKGDLIYMATSDDTMSLDCLEKMVATLESNQDCDVCQCGLQMIDRKGYPMNGDNGSLCWEKLANASFFGDRLKTSHVRKAPYDGLVALAYGTVWTSMTQVLVRRSLFDEAGLFQTEWGAIGDAAWQMKAGLLADVVFIPDKLATWRYYEGQGSGRVHQKALEQGWLHQMNHHAMKWIAQRNPGLEKAIYKFGLLRHFRLDALYHRIRPFLSRGSFMVGLRIICSDPLGYAELASLILRNKLPFIRPKMKSELVDSQIANILKITR